jgi:hypothetical protein
MQQKLQALATTFAQQHSALVNATSATASEQYEALANKAVGTLTQSAADSNIFCDLRADFDYYVTQA